MGKWQGFWGFRSKRCPALALRTQSSQEWSIAFYIDVVEQQVPGTWRVAIAVDCRKED
jgi:hypothetical protein